MVRVRSLRALVLRQLRRTRRQSATLGLLIVLTAALGNIGLICFTDYSKNLNRTAAQTQTEDIGLATLRAADNQAVIDAVQADPRVVQMEATPVRTITGTIDYGGAESTVLVALHDKDAPVALGRTRVVEQLEDPVPNPVFVPYLFKAVGDYRLGDEIVIRGSSGDLRFHVQGFVETVSLGSIQMGIVGMWLPQSEFASMAGNPAIADTTLVKARIDDTVDGEKVVGEISSTLGAEYRAAGQQPPTLWSTARGLTDQALTFVPSLFAVSLIFFAAVMIVSVAVVIRFLVKNSIMRDLRGIGTLKAVGFTSGQVMGSYLAFFLTGAALCTVAGVAMSYAVLPLVARSLSGQTGIVWRPGFSWLGLLSLLAVGCLAVALTTLLAGRQIRSIPPVHALRGGLATHTFTRNPLPLDRARGPLSLLLGVKSSIRRASQGAAVALVIGLVSMVSVFSVALYENVLADSTRFTNLVIGDFAEVEAHVDDGADRAQTLSAVRTATGVQKAFYNDYQDVSSAGVQFLTQVTENYSTQRVSMAYEGRDPKHANEVALGGRLAELLDVQVGDVIDLTIGQTQEQFVVVGLLQTARNMGQLAELTTSGYQRLDPGFTPSTIAVYTAGSTTPTELVATLKRADHGSLLSVTDNESNMRSQVDGYAAAAGVLAVAIVAITAAVVILVVSLVVTTTLTEERRSIGIHKAVGFTRRELMIQTCISYLLPVATGVILGCITGALLVDPLLSLALGRFGLVATSFALDPWLMLAMGAAIVTLAVALTLWRSRQIGRISAYTLLTE